MKRNNNEVFVRKFSNTPTYHKYTSALSNRLDTLLQL